ncbi:MAG: 2-phytyl-1,4-naphtoquinone methyltransferase [bacterium]|nr:2-phytyl-1,4-naphtoquinone methyltransferase [bacterium]
MKLHVDRIKKMYAVNAEAIKNIYSYSLPGIYDQKLSRAFEQWKAEAINVSTLQEGDKVIVFCCGSGNDFPHILNKIGEKGKILGVDFSSQMLNLARQKIVQGGWSNVELIEADVTKFKNIPNTPFDAGVCTLGMSIIPEYQKAYHNLLAHVKSGGEIIIGDIQLIAGWRLFLNSRIIYRAKEFGGSYKGHQNSRQIFAMMEKQLSHIRKQHFYNNAYVYCVGRKR